MRSTTKLAAAVAAVALPALLPALASAVPYASAPAVTGTAGTFVLNQAADAVTVTYGNGTTQTIDGSTAGTKSFTLPSAGSTYQITVGRTAAPDGFLSATPTVTPIGADVAFASPRGVAVNRNPNSPFFGRTYVANSNATPGDGIYVFSADKADVLGQGAVARTGGLDFATSGTNSPFRIQVGQDSNVYIGDAGTPATTGGIYRVDGDVSAASGQKVVTGQFPSSVVAEGSTDTGNLTVYGLDAAGTPSNGLFRYDVGSGPLPSAAAPTALGAPLIAVNGVTVDVTRAPNGNFFVTQDRNAGNDTGVFVFAPDGTTQLFDSLAASTAAGLDGDAVAAGTQDFLLQTRGVTISSDGTLAAFVTEASGVYILDLDADGLPILSSRRVLDPAFPTNTGFGRDIAFDAAGNLYVVSSGNALFRTLDAGGPSLNTLGFDGNTFTFTNGGPAVVPEPTALALIGGAGLLALRRRRRA